MHQALALQSILINAALVLYCSSITRVLIARLNPGLMYLVDRAGFEPTTLAPELRVHPVAIQRLPLASKGVCLMLRGVEAITGQNSSAEVPVQ